LQIIKKSSSTGIIQNEAMKNHLYPQPHQALNGSFDDYDSVIGNEFSVNSTGARSGAGVSNNSDDMDDMSSLGNSHLGPNSAANSPARTNLAAATQPHVPMTPLSSGSPESDALYVGDVSVILGSVDGGRIHYGGGDVESIGGDSLLMASPPARQATHLDRDAAEWNSSITHGYDAGTSKYLQLGPLGDELSFGGENAANINHPQYTGGSDLNVDADNDDEDDDTVVGYLPRGRFGQCLLIGSTMLVVFALVVAVVAILNLNSLSNNDASRFNIDAVGGVSDVAATNSTPTVPPSTLAPTVPATTNSPTFKPTNAHDPTAMPQKATEAPIASISTASPFKEPTTVEPTKSPTAATPSPTSIAPSKAPTTAEPTAAPSKAPTTDAPTPSPTEAAPLSTSSPSKAPTSDEPTASPVGTGSTSNATSSPVPTPSSQSLLTTGSDAFDFQDVHFYLVSDDLYVRQEWKRYFADLDTVQGQFLIHVGSATPSSDDCPEDAYTRTETSLSFSPLVAFSLPGNNDYPVSFTWCADVLNSLHPSTARSPNIAIYTPVSFLIIKDCPVPSTSWNRYSKNLMNVNEKYWNSTSAYQVKRDPLRPENFAFIYRRTLFVGLNMVSNEDSVETAARLEQNLQWVNDNVDPHEDNIDVIFLTGHGRSRDLPTFRDAIIAKKKGAWKNKMVVYARRAEASKLFVDVEGVTNLHELAVGKGYPITDVHLDITSKDAPRVGYRYIDGSPTV
jgi:hypothetical protein